MRQSQIDKKIAELQQGIEVNQHAIEVLRSVQQKKGPAKVKKPMATFVSPKAV